MTVIYTVEISQEIKDQAKADVAYESIVDEEKKNLWKRTLEEALNDFTGDSKAVCTKVQVFPDVEKGESDAK